MGFLDRFKSKTIEDVVETAKEAVSTTVKTAADDKVRGLLYLLPMVAAGAILFRSDSGEKSRPHDIPAKQIINYYYYGERQVNPRVDHDCKGCK